MSAHAKPLSPSWRVQGVASVVSPLLVLAAFLTHEVVQAEEPMPVFSIKALGGILEPAMIEVPAGMRFKIEIENEGNDPIEFECSDGSTWSTGKSRRREIVRHHQWTPAGDLHVL